MKYSNKPVNYFKGGRQTIIEKINLEKVQTLIDIGCSDGATLKLINKENHNIELWGVELMEEPAKEAQKQFQKIYIGTIEENLKNLPNNYFDAILMLDVIEHLAYPEDVLLILKSKLKFGGKIYSSIPNISHIKGIFNLLIKKDWKYESYGLMDYTHLRFFTPKSIKRMFNNLGYEIIDQRGMTPSSWWKHIFFTVFSFGYLYSNRYLHVYTEVRKTDSESLV